MKFNTIDKIEQADNRRKKRVQKENERKAQVQNNYNLYGNLFFHPLNGPISPRFFYFASLLLENDYKTPEYGKEAQRIGTQAQKILLNAGINAKDENGISSWEQKYTSIIAFLNEAIRTEQQNEQAYFQGKYNLFKSTFTPEEIQQSEEIKNIEKILANKDSLDYYEYILGINILLQGYSTTKEIFKNETLRLESLENGLKTMRENRERQLRGYYKDEKDIDSLMSAGLKRFDNQRIKTYLNQGNLSRLRGSKSNFKKVPVTADVAVGRWITDIINRIFLSPTYKKTAVATIKKCGYNKDDAEKQLKSILIRSITTYAVKHTDEILSGDIRKKNIRQILKSLEEDIEFNKTINIEGYYDNFGQFGHHLDYFSQGLEHVFDQDRNANEMYDAVIRLQKKLNNYKKEMKNRDEGLEVMDKLRGNGKNQINLQQRVKELNSFEYQFSIIERRASKQAQNIKNGKTAVTKGNEHLKVIDTTQSLKLGAQTIEIKIDNDGNISLVDEKAFKGKNNEFIQTLFKHGSAAKDIRGFIQSSKAQLSRQIKSRLDDELSSLQGAEQKAAYKMLEKTLQGLELSVGGPTLSEIKLGIQSSLVSETNSALVWSGKINLKNDFFEVFNPNIDIQGFSEEFNQYENEQIQELFKKMQTFLEQSQDEKSQQLAKNIQQIMKDASSGKIFTRKVPDPEHPGKTMEVQYTLQSYSEYSKAFHAAYRKYLENEESINKELDAMIEEIINLEADLEKREQLAQALKNKKINFLNSLQDTLFISSTMKTYNQYQNDLGFLGGSLGTNIEQQLQKVFSLFKGAGMDLSLAEKKWLLFAAINCSPVSVVGLANKDIIENYLGSMAIFALFDEAGNEITILKNSIDKRIDNPNILHLYGLNGIYYPGSLILQKILTGVQEMQNIINGSNAIKSAKNGVSLVNKTNYSMIPNNGHDKNTNNQSKGGINEHPWETVSNLAIANTSIRITFMAGLLDILNKLNEKMGELELP